MAINKKLIHFNTKANFITKKLSANSTNTQYYKYNSDNSTTSNTVGTPDIKYNSIVFIKDTQEIWTHGKLYTRAELSIGIVTTGTAGSNASASITTDNKLNLTIPRGNTGSTGTTFTPSVSTVGVISWTNDGGKTNPTSVNIKGPQGDSGNKWYTGTGVTGSSSTASIFSNSGVSLAEVGDLYLNTGTVYNGYVYECTVRGTASVAKWKYLTIIKGATGSAGTSAGFGTPTASVDNNVGTPSVTVTASGTNTSKVFSFAFKNLKGEPGTSGTNGADGSQIYYGTALTGTSTSNTQFASSGVTYANVNDMYINTSTYNVYKCTVEGSAYIARWAYVGCIKGADGASGTNGKTWLPSVDTSGNLSWTQSTSTTAPTTRNIKGQKGDKGDNGTNGTSAKWYTGTSCVTTSTTVAGKPSTGISYANLGDMYLNTSTSNVYECTTAGASGTAAWLYKCNIKGADGTALTFTGSNGITATKSGNSVTINGSTLNNKITSLESSVGDIYSNSVECRIGIAESSNDTGTSATNNRNTYLNSQFVQQVTHSIKIEGTEGIEVSSSGSGSPQTLAISGSSLKQDITNIQNNYAKITSSPSKVGDMKISNNKISIRTTQSSSAPVDTILNNGVVMTRGTGQSSLFKRSAITWTLRTPGSIPPGTLTLDSVDSGFTEVPDLVNSMQVGDSFILYPETGSTIMGSGTILYQYNGTAHGIAYIGPVGSTCEVTITDDEFTLGKSI